MEKIEAKKLAEALLQIERGINEARRITLAEMEFGGASEDFDKAYDLYHSLTAMHHIKICMETSWVYVKANQE